MLHTPLLLLSYGGACRGRPHFATAQTRRQHGLTTCLTWRNGATNQRYLIPSFWRVKKGSQQKPTVVTAGRCSSPILINRVKDQVNMDENDFDQILQTDFHPNTAPSLAHHHHEQDDDAHMLDPVVQEGQQQHADDDVNPQKPTDTEVHYDLSAAAAGLDSSSIGPLPGSPDSRSQHDQDFDHELGQGSSSTSTAADKKRKQRELNRLAATRSRRKKQGELCVLSNIYAHLSWPQ